EDEQVRTLDGACSYFGLDKHKSYTVKDDAEDKVMILSEYQLRVWRQGEKSSSTDAPKVLSEIKCTTKSDDYQVQNGKIQISGNAVSRKDLISDYERRISDQMKLGSKVILWPLAETKQTYTINSDSSVTIRARFASEGNTPLPILSSSDVGACAAA